MPLPVYRVTIKDKDYEQLKSNIWSNHFVPAQLVSGGKRIPIRIRYRGGHTREYPKKSYEIKTSKYTYHFNAEYDDPSMIRNALSFQFFNSIHVPSPSTRHCVLHLNHENLGVYLNIEAVKTPFFRKRGIPVRSIIYAVNDNADFTDKRSSGKSSFSGYNLIKGSERDRVKLSNFVQQIHLKVGAELQQYLRKHLDIENYLRWLCGAVLTGNYDGFNQNYTLFEHGKTRTYRMIPWDYEGTWGRNCYGKLVDSDLVKIQGYNKLTEKILSFRPHRQRYKALLSGFLESVFTVRRQLPIVYKMHNAIADHIYKDPNHKWSDKVFDSEPDTIRKYIDQRRQDIMNQLGSLD
ncbi:CotH kinase family protein [Virgibacillus sp. LDC1]|uniref:CotH kinase family protein n=1 Tax=Paenibacillus lautus TaxID=1401 RepID=UPI002DBE945C|nr:CotH kinase family protein [Paenibacillus lautus]MCV4230679.1 CotH kinase family protein [Virgibacillus sp. LDC1]MEC0305971.1 CotH kinase family protein [Paenibacillus lautus]